MTRPRPAMLSSSIRTADHDDSTCGATDCTLREAINAANAHPNTDANTPDKITFNIPLRNRAQTIQLGSALPAISDNVKSPAPAPICSPCAAAALRHLTCSR